MLEPPPVERARALIRFAKHCGSPLRQFQLYLTREEGFAMLDWFREQADPKFIDLALLDAAIVDAKYANDPWKVLPDFRLLGLEMVRWEALN